MKLHPRFLGLAAMGAALSFSALLYAQRRLAQLNSTEDPWSDADLGPLSGQYTTVTMSDGAEIGTVVAGPDNGPTVVLSHGVLANTRFWTLVAPQLVSHGCRVVAYDQRGHGDSTLGDSPFGVERLGKDLAEILTSLGVGPVTLVGHSMGAISVLAYLIGHKAERHSVTGAVLVSPITRSRPFSALLAKVAVAGDSPNMAGRDGMRLGALLTFGHRPPKSLVDLAIDITSACPPSTVVAAIEGLVSFDLRPKLETIDVPVSVLCGTHDRVTPPKYTREIESAVSDVSVRWIDREGHQLPLTSSVDVAAAVLQLSMKGSNGEEGDRKHEDTDREQPQIFVRPTPPDKDSE